MNLSRRACVLSWPALPLAALGLGGCAREAKAGGAMMIQEVSPETVALNDAAGLAAMWSAWQANTKAFEQAAQRRGWTMHDAAMQAGADAAQLKAIEASLGLALPAQLRWALQQAQSWAFNWDCDETPGGMTVEGVAKVWRCDADLLAQFQFWRGHHDQGNYYDAAFVAKQRATWAKHVPFCELYNGDILTIDAQSDDPAKQVVRYFCHEMYNGPHEEVLAPDFFSFISRWSAIGFLDLENFLMHGNSLDPRGPASQGMQAWINAEPKT